MALVTTAVVPVAGLGTRLLPATKSQPKEMLPVGGKPVVQHVVEELAAAGIERVVFVTGRGKGAIEDHFDRDPVLTAALEARGDQELLATLEFERMGVSFAYTRQPSPRGLGDAVLCAEGFTGDAPFAVALGDAILGTRNRPDVVGRLAQALDEHHAGCAIAVRDVPRQQTGRYGIVVTEGDGDVVRVTSIVEKPDPATAPSTLAVAARYVMSPAIYGALRATTSGASGELELTDAIARLIADGTPVVALRLGDVTRHDVGTHESYAAAFLRFALTDPGYGERMRGLARELLDDHA
jgi:UTP--glucose-1-phosphate uridylyltransferase